MISRKYKSANGKRVHSGAKAILRICILIFVFLAIYSAVMINKTLHGALLNQGKIYASRALSSQVALALSNSQDGYGKLLDLQRDERGKIIAIRTQAGEISALKASLTRDITEAMNERESYSFTIPMGTLLGSELLSGRGPDVTLRMVPMGYANIDIISLFEAAGINQTKHSLTLRINISYTTVVPFCKAQDTLVSDFLLTETIIVGDIPQYYTNFN